MKTKLSETLAENGIDFTFPIEIKDANGNETYYEDNGFWTKREYDADGNEIYYENSDGDTVRTYEDSEDSESMTVSTSMSQSCDSVSATLDDKAWETAQFVQNLCEVQNQYFDRLVDKAKEEKLYNGIHVETFTDHLFDYVFNTPIRNDHPEFMFSEYISTLKNSKTDVIDKDSQAEHDKKVTVNSRYNEPRHFYLIDNDWFYDVCGDSAVGMSCVPDGSLGHVDPSGGPFVGVDTNLSDIHKDLPDACVTKIERDTDRGLFKLSIFQRLRIQKH